MKKRLCLLLLSAALGMASCRVAETEADPGGNAAFPETNETEPSAISDETEPADSLDSLAEAELPAEAEPPVFAGFERVPTLEEPEFLEDNLWWESTEEEYYRESAVIAKGHASGLAEYRVFGDHYDYYITAFDFTLDEVFYGEGVRAGDVVSVGSFNSSYEYDESLPTLKENGEYILFLHSTAENEQVGELVGYNMPSPLFNCIPVVGDYCETKELFSDYGKSERKINLIKGKSLAYEALQNGEEAELKEDFADENYLALASEEAKYIFNRNSFENKLATTFVVRLAEFEETLRARIGEFK